MDAAREAVSRLTGGGRNVVFCAGATAALNQALLGVLPKPSLVGVDRMMHNAVRRPLAYRGSPLLLLPCFPNGRISVDAVRAWWPTGMDTLVLTHASNVTGVVQPLAELVEVAHQRSAIVIVDAAQTVGTLSPLGLVDADLVAFSGHKGLRTLPGVGCLLVRDGIDLDPLVRGGTGGEALPAHMPARIPERLEAGTVNLPGIASLGAAARAYQPWDAPGLALHLHEIVRSASFMPVAQGALPVVSFQAPGWGCDEAGAFLDERWNVTVRTGLHCAPQAHLHLGTCPAGTVRVSAGSVTTRADLEQLAAALRDLRAQTTRRR